jgi:hypothetical protein
MARGEFPAIEHVGDLMANNEYRRYAAECLLIADGITNAESRILLLAMAQAWLKLARRAEEDASGNVWGLPNSPPGKETAPSIGPTSTS